MTAQAGFDESPEVIGAFEERPFLRSRIPTIDTLAWSRAWHHVPILIEVDVTIARNAIRQQKAETGEGTSFTGWVVTCLAQAVSEHPRMHALRNGKRKLVMFHDVDVAIVVERAGRRGSEGDSLPMPYVIRKANEKPLASIHAEIRAAQTAPVAEGEVQVDAARAEWKTRLFTSLPRTLRNLLLWRGLRSDPFLAKRLIGTVSVTSVGMMGGRGMGWGVPSGIHPLLVAVGGIAERPALVASQWVPREHVGLTVSFDHDVTDGAPVARFLARLRDLMERGHGFAEPR